MLVAQRGLEMEVGDERGMVGGPFGAAFVVIDPGRVDAAWQVGVDVEVTGRNAWVNGVAIPVVR